MSKYPDRYKDLALEWVADNLDNPFILTRGSCPLLGGKAGQPSKPPRVRKTKTESMDPVARSKAIWMGGVKAAQRIMKGQHGHRT